MGGGSKSVTVGYKYYLGMHLALTHGPCDGMLDVYVGDRHVWQGVAEGSSNLVVDKQDLYGGDDKYGGVYASIDVAMGLPTQTKNDYLESKLGIAPAFRGISAAIFRQAYLGMAPYLEPWAFRVKRILNSTNGDAQWYSAKSQIVVESKTITGTGGVPYTGPGLLAYMGVASHTNLPTSPEDTTNPQHIIDYPNTADYVFGQVKEGVTGAQTLNPTTRIVPYNEDFITSFYCVMGTLVSSDTTGNIFLEFLDSSGSVIAQIKGVTTSGSGTSSTASVIFYGTTGGLTQAPVLGSQTPKLYGGTLTLKNGVCTYTSDGSWAGSTYAYTDSFSFNYNGKISQVRMSGTLYTVMVTSQDVYQWSITNSTVIGALYEIADMNPAHIIRECLTDTNWGMGYAAGDIDDAVFTAVADTLYADGFGLSLIWDRQKSIEDFIMDILSHIDAVLYIDRFTGKFKIRLIRDDFDVGTIQAFDESNIVRVDSFNRPSLADLPNTVTVVYVPHTTDDQEASVTMNDPALTSLQGCTIGTTVQYPGITQHAIASKVALRDLRSLSFPRLKVKLTCDRTAAYLYPGEVFKFSWPDLEVSDMVMRVMSVNLGSASSNRVVVEAIEDVTGDFNTVVIEESTETNDAAIITTATPPDYQITYEAPYFELVQNVGASYIDNLLVTNPDVGYVTTAVSRPVGAINAILLSDSGSSVFESFGTLDFCPYAILANDINQTDFQIVLSESDSISLARKDSYLIINGEMMRVDSADDSLLQVVVGRGVLDTVPSHHAAGSYVIFVDDYYKADGVEYTAGEIVQHKVLPSVSGEVLAEADALVTSTTLDSRAYRPYPPGNLKIDGLYYPEDYLVPTDTVVVTWNHRDRLQQTSGFFHDHTYGDIGPEAGTTYTLRAYTADVDGSRVDDTVIVEVTGLTNTYSYNIGTYPPASGYSRVRIEVSSVRDGYESLQAAYVSIRTISPPYNLNSIYAPFTAPYNLSHILVP